MNGFSDNFFINKKRGNFLRILTFSLFFLFLLLILNIFSPGIKNTIYSVSFPVEKVFWSAGASSSGYFSSVFKAGFISRENETLRNENQKLLLQVAALQTIAEGNQAQSNVSLACQNKNFETIMAGVTGLDEPDVLSLNKGRDDGILENMPVINQQGVVFGKIFKVYKNFSKVMLISHKSSVINVKIQQTQGQDPQPIEIEAVAKGGGGLQVYLDLIPINSEINQGDVLLTSAIEKALPKDLLVGTISQVQKDDQKPFQQARMEPYFDIKSAEYLFVITNYKQD